MWPNTTFPGGEGPVTFVVTIWLAGVQFGGKEITQALQIDPERPGHAAHGSWFGVVFGCKNSVKIVWNKKTVPQHP